MKLTVITKPHEKVEIENVTLFMCDYPKNTLEYWIGEYKLFKLTGVLAVQVVENDEEE